MKLNIRLRDAYGGQVEREGDCRLLTGTADCLPCAKIVPAREVGIAFTD